MSGAAISGQHRYFLIPRLLSKIMPIRRFVVDTSLFVNPDARGKFGKTPAAAATALMKKVRKLDIELYIPPSVFTELKNFITEKTANELELVVKKRAPNTFAIYLPAAVFYEFIDGVRGRINKGLRLAEQFAVDNRPENDEKLRRLRDKYREAMRAGILDSKEDFELILLAKELEATVVTSDEGAIQFANKIGCEWINASKFHDLLSKMKPGK